MHMRAVDLIKGGTMFQQAGNWLLPRTAFPKFFSLTNLISKHGICSSEIKFTFSTMAVHRVLRPVSGPKLLLWPNSLFAWADYTLWIDRLLYKVLVSLQ